MRLKQAKIYSGIHIVFIVINFIVCLNLAMWSLPRLLELSNKIGCMVF